LIYYFLSSKDFESFKIFLVGCSSATLIFAFFFYITSTPIVNFIYQYVLFPLSIGEGRISSNANAYVSFLDQINFKRLVGDFKFIHLILIPLIFLSIKNFSINNKIINYLNSIFIISVFAFLFNQLITANQIYIFSLIPILAALLHLNIELSKVNRKVVFLLFFVVLFATIKFHYRYNVERKFHDLESVDKSKAIAAKQIHQNLNSLKWLSKNDVPEVEVEVLQKAIRVIESDKREKTLITHYQFISTILNQNLNILNRWYLWDNNTHPTENHKYFDNYKSLVNKNIKSNNVEVIYLLGQKNEIIFDKIKNYFTDVCFKSKTLVENKFSIHEIVNCSK
jgi:signal transduction histidine kinase